MYSCSTPLADRVLLLPDGPLTTDVIHRVRFGREPFLLVLPDGARVLPRGLHLLLSQLQRRPDLAGIRACLIVPDDIACPGNRHLPVLVRRHRILAALEHADGRPARVSDLVRRLPLGHSSTCVADLEFPLRRVRDPERHCTPREAPFEEHHHRDPIEEHRHREPIDRRRIEARRRRRRPIAEEPERTERLRRRRVVVSPLRPVAKRLLGERVTIYRRGHGSRPLHGRIAALSDDMIIFHPDGGQTCYLSLADVSAICTGSATSPTSHNTSSSCFGHGNP